MVTDRWVVLLAAGFVPALLTGCKEDTQTQITVAVTSETKVPEELSDLEIVVTDAAGSERSRVVHPVAFQSFFPATLAIIPEDGGSIGAPVQVDVRAIKANGDGSTTDMVLRRSVVSFVQGRTLLLPMPLRMACFSIKSCGPTETCAGGTCVPADADEELLPDFDPALVFPTEAGDDCFDEAQCLPTSNQVQEVDYEQCTFPLPETGDVNVSIEWLAAPGRVIALDSEDPIEGWTRDGTTGKLSEGVCVALREQSPPNKALGVFVSTTCPPKRVNQPHCNGGVGAELAPP